MRKLALSLLAGSIAFLPHVASAQESAAPTADDYVCALTGDCGDEAEESEAPATTTEPGQGRLNATRGFSLSRPAPPRSTATPRATPRQAPRQTASRPARRTPRPAAQNPGRVDLRLAFANGSAELSASARAQIQAFAEALKRPQLANSRVRIEGHTDSAGGRALNLTLSQRRAESVANFLMSQGIDAARLEVKGYGYDRPLAGKPASADENRRVEAVRIS